jgi:phosphoglycolate phosphatase
MNIIFDFDGTLADSMQIFSEVINEVLVEMGRDPMNAEALEAARNVHLKDAMKLYNIPLHKLPTLVHKGKKRIVARMPEIQPIAGIPEVLALLHQRGDWLGLATSNSVLNARILLDGHRLDTYFSAFEGDIGLFSKAARIKKMIKQYKLDPKKTLYVGDETRDIEAAHKAGVSVAAVTFGANTRQLLESHEPTFIIDEPKQLLDIKLPVNG